MIKDRKAILVFLGPAIVGFSAFYLVPFVGGFYYCLLNNAVERNFVGLSNIVALFSNKAFLLALKNTCILTGMAVPLMIAVSFTIAFALKAVIGRYNVLRKVFILPLAVPTVSIAYVWMLIFEDNGAINRLWGMGPGGWTGWNSPDWLHSSLLYIPVVLIYLWKYAGFNIILFLGALSSVPAGLYEAASIDGAGWAVKVRRITLPYIFPTTFIVAILSVINSFRIFREVYVLCGSYPPQSVYMLQHFINNNLTRLNYEKLTSAAYIFAAIILVLLSILMKIERKSVAEAKQ